MLIQTQEVWGRAREAALLTAPFGGWGVLMLPWTKGLGSRALTDSAWGPLTQIKPFDSADEERINDFLKVIE